MKFPRFTRSIRWRFQLWLAFLLAVVLTGFGFTAHRLHRNNRFEQLDQELGRRLAALGSDVRRPPFPPGERGGPPPIREGGKRLRPEGEPAGPPAWRPLTDTNGDVLAPALPGRPPGPPGGWMETRPLRLAPATEGLFNDGTAAGYYFVVWSRGGRVLGSSSNAPGAVPPPGRPAETTARQTRSRGTLRETYQFTELGERVLVGMSVAGDLAAIRRFGWWLMAGGAAVLAFGLGGGWILVSRALRPVQAIGRTASRIAEGNLGERIDTADTENELGRLAGVLNSTFARLDAAFAQQKQFTADAAHELRTPIAVLISEAQATLARKRDPAEYRQALEECLAVAQQMRRLTESLLQLARLDAGQEHLSHEPIDLADTARECVDLVRPLAAGRGLRIVCDLAPAPTRGDAGRLAQVITNLLTNAIEYNREGGEIHVATRPGDGAACLEVTDTGLGIAGQDLPHIFERFYRADPSRTRANGRTGLGLAISKAIVEAHAGTLTVTSQAGRGSTFEVNLPA